MPSTKTGNAAAIRKTASKLTGLLLICLLAVLPLCGCSESSAADRTPEQAAEFSTQQASEYATEETAQAEEPDLGDTGEDETAEEDLSEILPEDETTDSAENS